MPRTRYLNKKSLAETLAVFVDNLSIRRREPELVQVEDSLHRITAEPVFARISAPHYHGAAMDGIAVRAEDTFGASEAQPAELELSPEPHGCARTFFYVILPALKGGIFSGTLLTFAHSLGEFGATAMVSGNLRMKTQTAPLFIFAQFEAGQIEIANAVAAVLAVLSFTIFLFLLRFTQNPAREGT